MLRLFVLALGLLLSGVAPSLAAKRALIIGNDVYSELPDLQKAVADAKAYEAVLKGLGYSVDLRTNLSTLDLQDAVGDFITSIEPDDEVAFVYAGHGWSDGSTNYIVGADTTLKTSVANLRRAAIPIRNGANGIVDDLQAQGARIVLAVVDACRNNPFQSKLGRSGSVGLSRGLALVTQASGTFTVFSAGAGEEALDRLGDDDTHPNSVFSRVFLEELSKGGSLQDIILDTAPQVAELAEKVGHTQRPAYYDGIGQRYCLTEDCQKRVAEKVLTPKPIPEPEPIAPVKVVKADPAPSVPQPEPANLAPEPFLAPGQPARFIMRADGPVRSTDQLRGQGICSVKDHGIAPTLLAFSDLRSFNGRAHRYRSLDDAVNSFVRKRCQGLAVAQTDVEVALATLGDPERFIVLPETARWAIPVPLEPFRGPVDPQPMTRDPAPFPGYGDLREARNAPGGPVQFITPLNSAVRSTTQLLPGKTVCSVKETSEQPTLQAFAELRGFSAQSRVYQSLRAAIVAFESKKCVGLALAPRFATQALAMMRDPTKYRILPDIVRWTVPNQTAESPFGPIDPQPTISVPDPFNGGAVPTQPILGEGAPIQFIVRNASPVRRVDQLKHDSICSVSQAAVQPTLTALAKKRGVTHNNRKAKNLRLAVKTLEGNKCNGLAVRPGEVPLVISMVRDPSRYIILTEVIQ